LTVDGDREDSWQLVASDARTGGRVLLGLLGALTILVGLLCLRAPLQTAVVLGLLIGATWVVGGVIGTFHAINDGPRGGRGWRIASGLLRARRRRRPHLRGREFGDPNLACWASSC
jgi:uncharacterized membrane protein HdeD (DUF308 family)